MPRRRPTAADLIDDAVEVAVDNLMDRAEGWMQRMRDQQREVFSEDYLRQIFTCAACRKHFPIDGMEMVHPANGFGTCKMCYRFMWTAAKQKMAELGKRAAQQAAHAGASRGAAPRPQDPPRTPPWEVLGISQDASVEEIKKAYRRQAAKWHPDMVPPGASSTEKEQARARFEELTRARDAMMKVRQPPQG